MQSPILRLVLDTNVWLDWLVFDEPLLAPLKAAVAERRAEIFIDAACEAELERVLAYDLGRHSIDAAARAGCLAECRRIARPVGSDPDSPGWGLTPNSLPRCADPGDQMFLEAALAARADCLVTKDRALLELGRGGRSIPFRIVTPDAWGQGWNSVCTLVQTNSGPDPRIPVKKKPHHNVYVIELDPAIYNVARFRRANPDHDITKPCVYVGCTGLTPEQRFAKHKAGIRANRYVQRFGLRLLPRLYAYANPMPYNAARDMEVELAIALREEGYAVWQG